MKYSLAMAALLFAAGMGTWAHGAPLPPPSLAPAQDASQPPAPAEEVKTKPAAKPAKPLSLKSAVGEMEKQMILEALQRTRNNQQQAARSLGLSRQGLINKMKRYAISA